MAKPIVSMVKAVAERIQVRNLPDVVRHHAQQAHRQILGLVVLQLAALHDHLAEAARDGLGGQANARVVLAAVDVAHQHIHLGVVPQLAQLQQLVEGAAAGQQPCQAPARRDTHAPHVPQQSVFVTRAPEGAPAEGGAGDALVLAVAGDLDHADAGADVHQQVREERLARVRPGHVGLLLVGVREGLVADGAQQEVRARHHAAHLVDLLQTQACRKHAQRAQLLLEEVGVLVRSSAGRLHHDFDVLAPLSTAAAAAVDQVQILGLDEVDAGLDVARLKLHKVQSPPRLFGGPRALVRRRMLVAKVHNLGQGAANVYREVRDGRALVGQLDGRRLDDGAGALEGIGSRWSRHTRWRRQQPHTDLVATRLSCKTAHEELQRTSTRWVPTVRVASLA
eukprot:scaffold585_cov311-Prasinococcus_capsulatus_cf.AAC.6